MGIWQHWKIGIVKSDSIHHFLENASTKSGTLQFPPFCGCELWIYHFVYDGSCLSLQTNTSVFPLFSVLNIKCCSSYTEYRNEMGCFTNFNMYHSWRHSPFLRKKVIMIRKLSISRSTYLQKNQLKNPEKSFRVYSWLPISKITTFGCEKENVRGISGCD
jgi:hypothetical protein